MRVEDQTVSNISISGIFARRINDRGDITMRDSRHFLISKTLKSFPNDVRRMILFGRCRLCV